MTRHKKPKREVGPPVECVECGTSAFADDLDDTGKCPTCMDTEVEVDVESGMCAECGLWICVCDR